MISEKEVIAYKALIARNNDIQIWETPMKGNNIDEGANGWRTTKVKALSELFDHHVLMAKKHIKILMKIPDKMIEVSNG